ncbi:MAG: hypothetical protein HUJ68_01355 [Clostridia bacterium]|nr:hypothetical protein [Clostridia bacterium]
MKLNISNYYVIHKSSSCFSKRGEPLSEYNTKPEADRSAAFVSNEIGTKMVSYLCSTCNKYHIKPEEFYFIKNEHGCTCKDHNGNPKSLYATQYDAVKMAELRGKTGVKLYVYQCPNRNGYHLTSSKGY